MTIKQILVANDLSPRSKLALKRAVSLANQHQAHLTAVHVLESTSWLVDKAKDAMDRKAPAEKKLRRQLKAAIGKFHIDFSILVIQGKAITEVLNAARQIEADLIVVGAHGEHFFRDVFLGSTTDKLVRQGDFPILVVRKPAKKLYGRVLVPVDFSDCSRGALKIALAIAPNAKFRILHAYQHLPLEDEERRMQPDTTVQNYLPQLKKLARQDLSSFLEGIDFAAHNIKRQLEYGYPPAIIREAAQKHHSDLTVVGASGKPDMRHLFLGSVASHALQELDCDVLVHRMGTA